MKRPKVIASNVTKMFQSI